VKWLKCNELISFLRSHSNLGSWIAPHFCSSESGGSIEKLQQQINLCSSKRGTQEDFELYYKEWIRNDGI